MTNRLPLAPMPTVDIPPTWGIISALLNKAEKFTVGYRPAIDAERWDFHFMPRTFVIQRFSEVVAAHKDYAPG